MANASAGNLLRTGSFVVLVALVARMVLSLSIVAILVVQTLLAVEIELERTVSERFWVLLYRSCPFLSQWYTPDSIH